MLCNSKTNNRPDKLLQLNLIKLAFALVLLTIAIILFFLYPEHHLLLVGATTFLCCYCLITTIRTLDAGEAAISYGGFANEIIHHDFKGRRIENPLGEAIIQNDIAKELLKSDKVLDFIKQHLTDGPSNKASLYRLQAAYDNLSSEKVILSLNLTPESNKVFSDFEWFEISIRPINLKCPHIFEGAFSIRKIKKETYLYWTITDITAQKNMEHIFKEENSFLHNFLDYMPIGLYTADHDYKIDYANNCFSEFLGVPLSSINNHRLQDFLSPDSPIPPRHDYWKGSVFFNDSQGTPHETFVLQTSYRQNEQIKIRGIVITQLPTSADLHQRLSADANRINSLFTQAPIGILFLDTNGNITDCNNSALSFFNQGKTELLHQQLTSFLRAEEISAFNNSIEQITKNSKNIINIDLHLNKTNPELITTLCFLPLHNLHHNHNSDLNGYVVYLLDATRQKSLEQQFAQAQKMQAIGQLAGGVAHDFNNLLTAMIGFTDLLLQRHGVGDPSFADLIQIQQNANRAAGLVRQLLAFSRKQSMQPRLINVTENFAELNHMLKRILGEQIKLKFIHGSDLGYIKVDPVQFSQVIINLAVNAKDAMNGNGELTIATRCDALTEDYHFGEDIISAGEFVVIDVKDNGCGIPAENLNRIFDPFFSTKENVVGSGTGLGLAMVYGIVSQTSGFIKVNSEVGVGTTFSIYLPRFEVSTEIEDTSNHNDMVTDKFGTPILQVQEKIATPVNINQKIIVGLNVSNAIDRSHTAPVKPARILFVEDEDSVRTFGIRALEKKGYQVVGCSSAENALDTINDNKNFDLLLTDMVMPGMNGAQLTKKVKEAIPGIKAILASGYSEEMVRQEIDNFDDFDFITKPYSLGDLTAKVFDVLNRN